LHERRLQDDTLYDTPDESLRGRGSTVRLRTEPGQSLLTLKGPAQPGIVKIRDEHETTIADATVLTTLFEMLGLRPSFRYQKFREEFAIDAAIVAVDETPIGVFVEIEASDVAAIVNIAARLGCSPADYILDSYRVLFASHQQQRGLAGVEMVFAGA
jgi:adenylate cyclase class 2